MTLVGKRCSLGKPYGLHHVIFLFVSYFFSKLFRGQDFGSNCASSWSLLVFYYLIDLLYSMRYVYYLLAIICFSFEGRNWFLLYHFWSLLILLLIFHQVLSRVLFLIVQFLCTFLDDSARTALQLPY